MLDWLYEWLFLEGLVLLLLESSLVSLVIERLLFIDDIDIFSEESLVFLDRLIHEATSLLAFLFFLN